MIKVQGLSFRVHRIKISRSMGLKVFHFGRLDLRLGARVWG